MSTQQLRERERERERELKEAVALGLGMRVSLLAHRIAFAWSRRCIFRDCVAFLYRIYRITTLGKTQMLCTNNRETPLTTAANENTWVWY